MKTKLNTFPLSAFRFPLLLGLLFLAFGSSVTLAGITGTNLLNLATYSAGTNNGNSYSPPGTHTINPQTYTVYHSITNPAWCSTNYLETSYDGGATWTITAVFVTGTNSQTETWTPNTTSLTATNRVRTVSTTNQTLYINANWNQ